MTMLDTIHEELSALQPLRDFTNAQPEDELNDDLGLDSLDIVSLAMRLEELLHIDLPERIIARWQNIADVVASVEKERV